MNLLANTTSRLTKEINNEGSLANYPRSPSCKRCGLGVGDSTSIPSAGVKMLSPLPGEYGRKAET